MILGQGTAQTDAAIIAEYEQFLDTTCSSESARVRERRRVAPGVMLRRIGKPLAEWTDDEIICLYAGRQKATLCYYNCFLAFLFFRGYRRATLHLLTSLPLHLSRQHRAALKPYRQRLKTAQTQLCYAAGAVGTELTLLTWLLAVTGKTLEQLSRADFEAFRDDYQTWYRTAQRRAEGDLDARLGRLERYLIHWGVLLPARVTFKHEEHFAHLRHAPICQAILIFMQWCDAKYRPSTIHNYRAALLNFFIWFQEQAPDQARLDSVSRAVALQYAQYLKSKVDDGTYSPKYRKDLYRCVRQFFDFVIEERLDTAPPRNPLSHRDLPRTPDPVPRYLADRELRQVLTYCEQEALLKERTLVITLLHTGIRAAELAALQVSDVVQIQNQWKLHIHAGKGLKDRVIPLTAQCLAVLQAWQAEGWEQVNAYLFTRHGRPWQGGANVSEVIRGIGHKVGVSELTPHRFRHTFAVALLNYGMRESALQKLLGHATLNMTLEYARILDRTVEQSFNTAVAQMAQGSLSWVPNFFATQDYMLFTEADTLNWIRLPHGYCRRHHQLHCESDVKCLLCDRFCALSGDLPRLREMQRRFQDLGMSVKADVVASQIRHLEATTDDEQPPVFQEALQQACAFAT